MAKVQGGELMVFLNGHSIAYATNHTLTVGSETADTSNKDEGAGGWASSEVKLLNWSMTTENLYTESGNGYMYGHLFQAMTNKEPVTILFGHKAQTADEVIDGGWTPASGMLLQNTYSGKAIISDLSLTAQNGEYATFTATFTGVGALTFTGDNSWEGSTIPPLAISSSGSNSGSTTTGTNDGTSGGNQSQNPNP